jgi:hypothetical protein
MIIDGIIYARSNDTGWRLHQLTAQAEDDALLTSSHRRLEERPGELGGFTVTVTMERALGSMNVTVALDGVPGIEVRMTPAEIDQLTAETAHAGDDIVRPFPQADQLGSNLKDAAWCRLVDYAREASLRGVGWVFLAVGGAGGGPAVRVRPRRPRRWSR